MGAHVRYPRNPRGLTVLFDEADVDYTYSQGNAGGCEQREALLEELRRLADDKSHRCFLTLALAVTPGTPVSRWDEKRTAAAEIMQLLGHQCVRRIAIPEIRKPGLLHLAKSIAEVYAEGYHLPPFDAALFGPPHRRLPMRVRRPRRALSHASSFGNLSKFPRHRNSKAVSDFYEQSDHQKMMEALRDVGTAFLGGFTELREIQAHVIPPILRGQNLLVCSSTASGKTEAILTPLIRRIRLTPLETAEIWPSSFSRSRRRERW